MTNNNRVNFKQLLEERNKNQVTSGDITFLGGQVAVAEAHEWLDKWSKIKIPWRLWEYVSEIYLQEDTLPASVELLERGRLFGTDGDLTLRRDGEHFRWWFVGSKDLQLPSEHGGQCFWEANPGTLFHAIEQQAILWGAYQGHDSSQKQKHYWYDDRVGRADLHYPSQKLEKKHHVFAKYREYLDSGRVAAVWMYDLEGI